jgi:hypothetical protein
MGKIAHFGGVLPVVIRHVFQQSGYLCQIRRRAVAVIAVSVGMVMPVLVAAMPVGMIMIMPMLVAFMHFLHVLPPETSSKDIQPRTTPTITNFQVKVILLFMKPNRRFVMVIFPGIFRNCSCCYL